MKIKPLLLTIALLFSTPAWAINLQAKCLSSSGQTSYDIDILSGEGRIRMQFMGQDVLYRVVDLSSKNNMIYGNAVFEFAYSGEERGKPMSFTYDPKSQEFNEYNVNSKCRPN